MSRILNMALYLIQSYICRKQTIYAVHTKLIFQYYHTNYIVGRVCPLIFVATPIGDSTFYDCQLFSVSHGIGNSSHDIERVNMNSSDFHGWKSVVGGFLIHLVLGTLYLWGNITEAVTAHLRKYDSTVTYNDTLLVYACSLAGQGSFMVIGGLIEAKIGARKCCLIGGSILVAGTLLSSVATSLNALLLTNGIMFGVGMGICYSAPIACASRWLPGKKGLLSGIIVAGFGGGAFVFGQIALNIVNPSREGIPGGGTSKESYYDADSTIANQVPKMFLYLGCCYAVLILLGSSLLSDPPITLSPQIVEEKPCDVTSDDSEANCSPNRLLNGIAYQSAQIGDDAKIKKWTYLGGDNGKYSEVFSLEKGPLLDKSPMQLLRTPLAWHLASCIITTTIGGMYLCGTYKTFGQLSFSDEMYLSTVASTASLFSAAGRVFWGALGDKIGALEALMLMSAVFSAIIVSYPLSPLLGKAGFAIWTFSIFFLEGGNFALYMPLTIDTFGSRFSGANYGLIFTSYSIFSVLNITVLAFCAISYDVACRLMAAFTFIGFLNLCLFWRSARLRTPVAA